MTEAKKDYRTISVTNMPRPVLEAFLSGDLDWEETYAKYPGANYYISVLPPAPLSDIFEPINHDCAICGDDCIDDAHNPNNSRPKDDKWTR